MKKHLAPIVLSLFLSASPLWAQSISFSEGVSGDIDKRHRGPTISISTETTSGGARLLVDAYAKNKQFQKYPVRFDFYVNRRLFSSQIRSAEQPGAIGIDVGADIAPMPFDYAVIASFVHPNTQYVSMAQGTVFRQSLGTTLDCSLTIDDGTSVLTFDQAGVSINQVSNGRITFSFTGTDPDTAEEATTSGALAIANNKAIGTLSIARGGGAGDVAVSGTSVGTSSLESFDVQSSDGLTKLSCGPTAL